MALFKLPSIIFGLFSVVTALQLQNLDNFDAIAAFSTTYFPSKPINGHLCWKNGKIKELTIKLNQHGLSFQNAVDFKFEIKDSLVFIDMQCNYEKIMKKDQAKFLRNTLFLNVQNCNDLPEWDYSFPQSKNYIFTDNSFTRCEKNKKSSEWKATPIATYNEQTLMPIKKNVEPYKMAEDQTIEVTFVASHSTQKNIQDFRRNLNLEATNRFNFQLFSEVFHFLNVTLTTSFIPNLSSLREPTSLIAHPQAVSRGNYTNYDFISSQTPKKNTFLMRAPSLSAVSNVFTLPLELNVWYASYVLIVILLIAVFIIVRVEWKFPDMVPNKYRILYPNVMDVVQMHVGAIAQQGSEAEPTSGGGRIATFLIFLLFLFLYTAYSANIVALLSSTTTRVHGVKDLKDYSVKLGIDRDHFTKDLFKNQKSTEHLALYYEKLAKDDCYMTMEKGLDRIRNEFFAFHGDSDQIYKLIEKNFVDNEKCGFVEIPYLSEADNLIPIRKHSIFKEALKVGLALFLERGMHSRIKNIIFAKQPICYSGGSNFVSVSLLDCYFAFVIYCGGTGAAIMIFIFELLTFRSKVHEMLKFGFNLKKVVDLQEENAMDEEQLPGRLSSSSTIDYHQYID